MAEKLQNILKERKIKIIAYCKVCGQAVRQRKRDGIWIHYGWNPHAGIESYRSFLERTNHPVVIGEIREVPTNPLSIVEE